MKKPTRAVLSTVLLCIVCASALAFTQRGGAKAADKAKLIAGYSGF